MAKKAQVYSRQLCVAILRGCRNQLVKDGRLTIGVVGMQRPDELPDEDLWGICLRYLGGRADSHVKPPATRPPSPRAPSLTPSSLP